MSVFLVLTPIGIFIDPFTIVLAQSVNIEPQSTSPVCRHTLRPFHINRYLIFPVLQIRKSCAWIAVSI